MKRREFIALLGGTAATWPLAAGAQKPPALIGFLASGAAGSAGSLVQIGHQQGLSDNGLIEGQDYVLPAKKAFSRGRRDACSEDCFGDLRVQRAGGG
jgi:hypothetical protein